VGEQGIVIGWSFDRSNRTQDQKLPSGAPSKKSSDSQSAPKVVKAPVVGNAECFRANAHFRSLSSNRTFCAGIQTEERDRHQSSASIYTGISGAGLFIRRNNRWMLRGTVSAALPAAESPDPGATSHKFCCKNQYIIYADVAKFLDWITAFII